MLLNSPQCVARMAAINPGHPGIIGTESSHEAVIAGKLVMMAPHSVTRGKKGQWHSFNLFLSATETL